MKRIRTKTTNKPADAIFSADLHISEAAPVSRTDDYLEAQRKKLAFLQDLQRQHGCPVIDAGDIFNHWKPSPWLITRAYMFLPDDMYTIPGNHDLPEHSMNMYHKSGLATLEVAAKLQVVEREMFIKINNHADPSRWLGLYGIEYGAPDEELETAEINTEVGRRILILHQMVWSSRKPPYPNAEGCSGDELLDQVKDRFDVILTGHHHVGFTLTADNGSILINPGPMMRISADKADYKPRCYLYYADSNEVKPVYYPIEENVHDDSHLVKPKERDERLAAYIEQMNMEWEIGLSFQANLEAFFARNDVPKRVKDLIWRSLEKTD